MPAHGQSRVVIITWWRLGSRRIRKWEKENMKGKERLVGGRKEGNTDKGRERQVESWIQRKNKFKFCLPGRYNSKILRQLLFLSFWVSVLFSIYCSTQKIEFHVGKLLLPKYHLQLNKSGVGGLCQEHFSLVFMFEDICHFHFQSISEPSMVCVSIFPVWLFAFS